MEEHLALLRDRFHFCLAFSVCSLSAKRPQSSTPLAHVIVATFEINSEGLKPAEIDSETLYEAGGAGLCRVSPTRRIANRVKPHPEAF
jgi:hypothetical protein